MKRRTLLTGLVASPLVGFMPAVTAGEQAVLVARLVNTPREQLTGWVVEEIKSGRLRKPALIKALLAAGVSHIEPRPVGFKYHAVLMVDAARRLSIQGEGVASWIPLLWNVDYFKHSQARNRNLSGWVLGATQEGLPPLSEAATLYQQGMKDRIWLQADRAITRLARSGSMHQVFALMLAWAVRDFHSIGHKAILLAGVCRSLEYSGWRDSEMILRGVTYALLADGNLSADTQNNWWEQDYPANLKLARDIPDHSFRPGADSSGTRALLGSLRADGVELNRQRVIERLNRGMPLQALWDAVFLAAADSVMNRPTIPMLHTVTVTHALYSLWQRAADPVLRRVIPLQAVSYVVQMKQQRGEGGWNGLDILDFSAEPSTERSTLPLIEKIGESLGYAPQDARLLLQSYPMEAWPQLKQQLNRWLLYKSNKAHDFKYGAAVLETVGWLSPEWRVPYLAAASRLLMGLNMPDSVEGQKIEQWLGSAFG